MTVARPPDGDLEAGAGGAESPVEHSPRERLPAVDGLRGLASLAVVTTHVAFATGQYVNGTPGALLARLEIGVAVFFALSGFLLSRPWLEAAALGTRRPRTAAYLWRRALRILPAYWLAVVAAFLLLPDNDDVGPGDWLRHLLLVQVYPSDWNRIGLSQMWSLCTEAAFYLCLPLLAAVVLRRLASGWRLGPPLLAAGGMIAVGVVTTYAAHVEGTPLPSSAGLWLLPHAGWFGAGFALAALSVHRRARAERGAGVEAVLGAAAQPVACWVAAGAVLWISATPLAGPVTLERPTPGEAVISEVLYLVIAALLLLPLALGPATGLLRAALSSPPARRLGDLSYGIFLFHLIVLEGVMVILEQPDFSGSFGQTFLLTVTASWLLAAVSRRWVERPAMRLRHLVPAEARTRRRRTAGTAL